MAACRLLLLMLCFAGAQAVRAAPALPAGVPTHIIVFRDGVDPDATMAELAATHGLTTANIYRHALKAAAAVIPPQRLAALQRDPRVAYVEANQVFRATAQTLPTGTDRINADLDPVAKIDGIDERVNVDIAIIDSGIELTHPDLNIYRYTNCARGSPANQTCRDNDANATDLYGHGTHVAGIAAALDNATGTVGVAPGARLWNVRVLDSTGNGYTSWIIAGIDYVTAHANEIDVANMSLGCVCSSPSMETAISNSIAAGVVYAIAAGNDATDVANVSPAGTPGAITVSALTDYDGKPGGLKNVTLAFSICTESRDDSFACFSNYGSGVTIMAPGVDILSTYLNGGTTKMSGTSMASPYVAGAAALYRVKHPGSTPAQVTAGLLAEADTAPCANGTNGRCADDPDGIQEPLVMLHCVDTDGDGVCDNTDVCPLISDPAQTDGDGDGVGNACDNCPINANANQADSDGDGVGDACDNCASVANANQSDNDSDGLGDACDTDDDNDGLTDTFETQIGTNPLIADSDGDGLSDYAEVNYDGNPAAYSPGFDLNPLSGDTDGDGLGDGADPIPLLYNYNDGDVAPPGAPDGKINAADYMVEQQIVSGLLTVTPQDLAHGDLYPPNAPDGVIDIRDMLLLMQK